MITAQLTVLIAMLQAGQFTTETWVGEGIPILATAAPKVALYSRASSAAAVVDSLTLPVGTRIEFDSTRLVTIRSGLITFDQPGTISGRVLGPITYLSRLAYYGSRFPTDTFHLPSGAQVAYLQYRAELTCFVAVGTDVIEAHPCPITRGSNAHVIREPDLEWWVLIVVDGRPRGWALVTANTLQQVDRRF